MHQNEHVGTQELWALLNNDTRVLVDDRDELRQFGGATTRVTVDDYRLTTAKSAPSAKLVDHELSYE